MQPAMHECLGKKRICCHHCYRFGFHHQYTESQTSCICTAPRPVTYDIDSLLSPLRERKRYIHFDDVVRKWEPFFGFTIFTNDTCEEGMSFIERTIIVSCGGYNNNVNPFDYDGRRMCYTDPGLLVTLLYRFDAQLDIRIRMFKALSGKRVKCGMLLEEWMTTGGNGCFPKFIDLEPFQTRFNFTASLEEDSNDEQRERELADEEEIEALIRLDEELQEEEMQASLKKQKHQK